jgi:hypothetical protein
MRKLDQDALVIRPVVVDRVRRVGKLVVLVLPTSLPIIFWYSTCSAVIPRVVVQRFYRVTPIKTLEGDANEAILNCNHAASLANALARCQRLNAHIGQKFLVLP